MRKYAKIITLCFRKGRWPLFILLIVYFTVHSWNYNSATSKDWKLSIESFVSKTSFYGTDTGSKKDQQQSSHISSDSVRDSLSLEVNMTALKYRVRDRKECTDVAANPRSFWRSQDVEGVLNTSAIDIARMGLAYSCGMLYPDFFSKPPIPKLYPLEKFYLSEPPLVNIDSVSNENISVITLINSSVHFKVGETVAFKIVMKDSKGNPKLLGGDEIRVWFEDRVTKSNMAAKVVDLNDGTYIASAPLMWTGKLRVLAALAYPREYIRALLYTQQVLKAFRHVAGVFIHNGASEATPCYHTQVVPGFDTSELCDLTDVNGAPWFCGHPLKRQLKCSHYAGSVVILENVNYPVTDAEMELFNRSCREPRIRRIPHNLELTVSPGVLSDKIPCNQVLPQATWEQDVPIGYTYQNTYYSRLCYFTKPDYTACFKHKQVVIFGDSNARSHYYQIRAVSKCADVKKALTQKWHKPLLCVHKENNFSLSWNPHTNPFMHGKDLAPLDSLVPTSNSIDEIPPVGEYLIILHHYYHLTPYHISVFEALLRKIKDALVRLFKRNRNVQVVLQGPHISWFGWPEHYAAGDMLGTAIMDLQREIFHDIKDKVIFISNWDMTIAAASMAYHPSTSTQLFSVIADFTCGR